MADKQAFVLDRWDGGENTEDNSDALQINQSPKSENANFKRVSSLRKDDGVTELGSDSEDAQIWRLVKLPNRNGTNWLGKFVGTKLKLYDSANSVWNTIKTGLTENLEWDYDVRNNVAIFVSDTDTAMSLDLGLVTTLDGAILDGAATIDLVDASSYPSSGTVYINNTAVTYTGKSSNQLTGCSGAIATDDGYLAVGALSDEADIPKGNMCIDFGGRLIVAGVTGSGGATLYGSKATDRTDFTIAGGGAADDAFAEVMKAEIKAIRVFYDDSLEERVVAFLSNNNTYAINATDDASLGTLVSQKLFKQNVTALNQRTTLVAPNDIIHIDLDNQVRTLGPSNTDGSGIRYSDSRSKKRKTDFRDNYDFSSGASAIANNEYWLACKKGGGDYNNRFVVYDITTGAWRSRTGLSASDVIEFDNKITIALATENKVLQIDPASLNDGYDSEGTAQPIFFSHDTPDIDVNPMVFERLQYIKIIGKISEAGKLYLNVYRDFGNIQLGRFLIAGNNNNITGVLESTEEGGEFGNVAFGTSPIGTGSGDDKRFFIAMLQMDSMPDFENFRINFENTQADVYVEIFKVKPIYGQIMNEDYFPNDYILNNYNEEE